MNSQQWQSTWMKVKIILENLKATNSHTKDQSQLALVSTKIRWIQNLMKLLANWRN